MDVRLYWRSSGLSRRGCLAGLVPWLLGLNLFAVMAILAHFYSYFPADLWVSHRIQDMGGVWYRDSLNAAERMSDTPLILVVWLVFFGGFIWARLWGEAFLWLAAIAARPAEALMKIIVDRPRPSPELVAVHGAPADAAFPSGHVVGSFLIYGLIFYFAAVLIPNRWLRLLVQAVCLYVITFDAMERIWAGHHWFSDVYSGMLFAALYLAELIWLHRHVIRRQVLAP
ncbi:MAG TPA: phosphatase PAP2 family protein [Dehalococcoidia bacterium]|nr:phosphatase PAP2 family protein [Dehalococcoidia bacterium]